MAEKKYVELMKSFGKAVRFYRNKLGLSQEALADRAQLDRSYMSQIERGIKNATLNSIWRISQALEVTPSVLLKLTEELSGIAKIEVQTNFAAKAIEAVAQASGGIQAAPRTAENPENPGAILIVDDDQEICAIVSAILAREGFQTREATCGFDAFWIVATEKIAAVISDIRMNNGSGLELLSAMQKHYPKIPVMLFSGYDDLTDDDARRLGARALISKPFEASQFLALVRSSVAEARSS